LFVLQRWGAYDIFMQKVTPFFQKKVLFHL
jgi:hypothetical protein